jgi:hypothetical protein|tara:strand:- start:3520 stop:3672 length:153 start_codon:yes stop_codon:yes gene_type:complete
MNERRCRDAKDFTGAWIHFGTHDVSDGKAVLKDLKGDQWLGSEPLGFSLG